MRLALAPLLRAPVRTLLLILTVAALVFVVEFLATLSGTLQSFSTGALAHDRADLFVYAADAQGSLDASRLPTGLAAQAARVPGVAAAADLGVFDFTVTGRPAAFELALFGVGPGASSTGARTHGGARPGWPASASGPLPRPGQGVADSTETAAGLGRGQRLELAPGGTRLRITGLARGVRYDGVITAWTTFRTWARAVRAANPGRAGAAANAVAVQARRGLPAAVLARRLNRALPGTRAFTRAAAVADAPGASVIAATFDVLIGIAFGVTVLAVGAVFLLATVARLPGWTMLRALGASARRLGLMLLAQVTLVIVAASALAFAALTAVTDLSSATFPVRAGPSLALVTFLAVELGALASALLPVRRISRLDPAAALARR